MKKKVLQEKLKEQKGASVLIALFVLLVCLIISSIVVTAGHASAGRIASVAKTDQRYYTVSSAANLFKEEIVNKPVVITRESKKTGNADPEYKCYFGIPDDKYTCEMGISYLNDVAIIYALEGKIDEDPDDQVLLESGENYEATYKNFVKPVGDDPTKKSFVVDTDETDIDLAEVSIDLDLKKNGELEMIVKDLGEGEDHYKLEYIFSCDLHEQEDTNEYMNNSKQTVIEKVKTTTLNWVLQSVKKYEEPEE